MELKSQDEKKRLEREKQEAKEKMNLEIQGWSKRYEELKMQKSQIEKESNNLLKNMEATNLKAVEVSIEASLLPFSLLSLPTLFFLAYIYIILNLLLGIGEFI